MKSSTICGCEHAANLHSSEGCEACYCEKFESKEADERRKLHGRFHPYRVPKFTRATKKA